jgi:putative acetyltransferase
MHIRAERPADIPGIHGVNLAAFETDAEARLVDTLREQAAPLISLIAEDEQAIVGHILFSPVTLTAAPELRIAGLAPMAVLPAWQRRGVGSLLVHAGLEQCRALGFCAAVVLGHSHYYPRFGFTPASRFGLRSEYEVPDDVFMAMELEESSLRGKSGQIAYHAAFASV